MTWIIDMGATVHVTCVDSVFQGRTKRPRPGLILSANGQALKTEFCGDVHLIQHNKSLILKDTVSLQTFVQI